MFHILEKSCLIIQKEFQTKPQKASLIKKMTERKNQHNSSHPVQRSFQEKSFFYLKTILSFLLLLYRKSQRIYEEECLKAIDRITKIAHKAQELEWKFSPHKEFNEKVFCFVSKNKNTTLKRKEKTLLSHIWEFVFWLIIILTWSICQHIFVGSSLQIYPSLEPISTTLF